MEENTQVKKEEAEILENAQQNGEKKWKKYVRIGFLLLVAVFLIRYFYKNYDSYKNLDIEINWPVFAGALLFLFHLSGDAGFFMALHHETEQVFYSIFQGDHSVSVFDSGKIYSGKGFYAAGTCAAV